MSTESIRPNSHVGFASITQQIEHRLLKRGFQFNIMVVGQSGLGKTTLVNTLFAAPLAQSSGRTSAHEPAERTPEIKVTSKVIQEHNVKLKLNIIDTPGFGDQVVNDRCWEPIVKYIKDQYSAYLKLELTTERVKYLPDTRVHCVLYFIQPTGHGLKELDIIVLKKLSDIVNVVPVIAKADSLTLQERQAFKATIQEELRYHGIRLYPYDDEDEYDESERALNAQIAATIPFAVVGSEKLVTVNGEQVRGRRNRWGVVNVEDRNHCEFPDLREFLVSTHLQDLIDTTTYVHYEYFRAKQLESLAQSKGANGAARHTSRG